jgi:cell division protein FtsL
MKRLYVIAALAAGALMVGTFHAKNETDRLRKEIASAERELAALKEANEKLSLDFGALAAPQRIRELASTHLGHREPDPHTQIRALGETPITAPEQAPAPDAAPVAEGTP